MNSQLLDRVLNHPSAPSIPAFVIRVIEHCNKDGVSLQQVAELIESDARTAERILQLANSPLFSRGEEVRTIAQAVAALGLRTVCTLTLVSTLVSSLSKNAQNSQHQKNLWKGAVVTALAAQQLSRVQRGVSSDEAFLAGLVQDVGSFLLDSELGEQYESIVRDSEERGGNLSHVERHRLELTHPEVAGVLLRRWGLPDSLVNAIERHEDQDMAHPREQTNVLATVLNVAESYRRVFQTPGRQQVAEMIERSRRLLGQTEEQSAENLSYVERMVKDAAEGMQINVGSPEAFEDSRVRATELLVDLIIDAQADDMRSAARKSSGAASGERRRTRKGLTLFRVAVDRVQSFVDYSGHPLASEILERVAKRLRASLRRGDLLLRWSELELLILAPACSGADSLRVGASLAEVIRSQSIETAAGAVPTTISLGAAWDSDREHQIFSDLLERANHCLAQAQENGGNQVIGSGIDPERASAQSPKATQPRLVDFLPDV